MLRVAAAQFRDDLGAALLREGAATRVVSLVPSLTEAIAATNPDALVGATDWCTHPADLDVARVRGTKNPDLAAITALRPDVVIANKEENRRLDVQRLRSAGVSVWVTDIETVEQALTSLQRLFADALGWAEPDWLAQARAVWAAPDEPAGPRVAIPIWREPWMVVGSRTFTGDLARRLGLRNVFGEHPQRYPKVSVEEIRARGVELVVLPDEPYRFSGSDGPDAFPGLPCALVEGRLLTWYGPSLATARSQLLASLRA